MKHELDRYIQNAEIFRAQGQAALTPMPIPMPVPMPTPSSSVFSSLMDVDSQDEEDSDAGEVWHVDEDGYLHSPLGM